MDIVLDNISKSFSGSPVLEGVSLRFPEGETSCIMGPSGCGKTTLLNIIAGLTAPDGGSLTGTTGRSMAYAFQEPRLLPWKTVAENVGFVLPADMDPEARRARAMECLSLVDLSDAAGMLPSRLSGGMAQRVSLARALAPRADILLLDEAFCAIDTSLRESIIARLKAIFAQDGTTVIAVTHSAGEAALLGGTVRLVD